MLGYSLSERPGEIVVVATCKTKQYSSMGLAKGLNGRNYHLVFTPRLILFTAQQNLYIINVLIYTVNKKQNKHNFHQ
jgi:hypothetical protein